MPTQENQNTNNGITAFVSEVARYFMDFLETNFHKRRTPKRSIKYRDNNNLLLGLNLRKYEKFNSKIWKVINSTFDKDSHLAVMRGNYTTQISPKILDLIAKQIETITGDQTDQVILLIRDHIQTASAEYNEEADKAYSQALDKTSKTIRDILIKPFLDRIEKSILSQSSSDIESIYSIEESLTDILTLPLEDIISENINYIIVGEEVDFLEQLTKVLDLETVKNIMRVFFSNFSTNDLYFEIQELVNNKHLLDKHELYLYFFDIEFNKQRYPIFYTPLTIKKESDTFQFIFDSSVYINKKAIEYVVQEYNKEKEKRGRLKSISERILYLDEHAEDFQHTLIEIMNEVTDYFQLSPSIDFLEQKQISKSVLANVSNSCHICIFDKSDEALINDYEEMLKLLSSEDNLLSDIFNKLINDFIKEDPKRFNREVENEWDDSEVNEKLVFKSPIPLNEEQRQIISALNKDECKYITVEGPPGTGKSHTITAIVFNAILKNQSILVLSDKKEALDVVENKITDTMNKVRHDEDFQNPILRLGKSGNTYNKILSTTSIKNIKEYYRAVRQQYDSLQQNIKSIKDGLSKDINSTIFTYESIKIEDIYELIQLDSRYNKGQSYPFDFDEFIGQIDSVGEINKLRESIINLDATLHEESNGQSLRKLMEMFNRKTVTADNLKIFLILIGIVQQLKKQYSSEFEVLKYFKSFSNSNLEDLIAYIKRADELNRGIFGAFFKWGKKAALNKEFNEKLPCIERINVLKNLDILKTSLNIISDAAKLGKEKYIFGDINYDYLKNIHEFLTKDIPLAENINTQGTILDIKGIEVFSNKYPRTSHAIGLKTSEFETYYDNKLKTLSSEIIATFIRHIELTQSLNNKFKSLPDLDYVGTKSDLEDLCTIEMTHILDKRLLDFCEVSMGTARTLKGIIRKKKRFPKKEFTKLKEAFPCIIAGIRDYAEYIPLEPNLFDLVIIDEASQVSIAQAFPALLRAHKIIVFGDKKQFSNVKSAHARSDINQVYLSRLENSFKTNISTDLSELERLSRFDIRTSILEFFEFISNYEAMLFKHFRGYRENISYSNKYFYNNKLQTIKLRSKRIEDVLKFSEIKHNGRIEVINNTNKQEIEFIIGELNKIKEKGGNVSVGIITPHTNQQKLISADISNLPDRDYFYEKLKLKIMTFDTCQGEERDIIFYSMVATNESDKLWGVFIKDLSTVDIEESRKIKAQRLNVGFSRAKECMHFVISKPLEKFRGAIGDALKHYLNILVEEKRLPEISDVDPSSPMEGKVLEWIKNTEFFQKYSPSIELKAQFPIGKYLKQLDKNYSHPAYRIDFLLIFIDQKEIDHKIIIEYDGFKEHFEKYGDINEFNYENYYTKYDVERENILESYGYKFLRINRFNTGKDPIKTLSDRLTKLVKKKLIKAQ
jgi:very-short-patch-repair endonuclease